jgi:hypothetical protein
MLETQLHKHGILRDYRRLRCKILSFEPFLVENGKRVKELTERKFEPSGEISSACPLSGEDCTTAKLYSESADRKRFELDIQNHVDEIKREKPTNFDTRNVGGKCEVSENQSGVTQYEDAFNKAVLENLKIEKYNEFFRNAFHSTKSTEIDTLKTDLNTLKQSLSTFNENLTTAQNQLSALKEPELLKMPEEMQISDELKMHTQNLKF